MERDIATSLNGFTTAVSTTQAGLGQRLGLHIKAGAVEAAAAGRSCYSLEEFTAKLEMAARNMHGVSDHMMPVELVLNVGVSALVEAYK